MFESLIENRTLLGHIWRTPRHTFFFGSRHTSREHLHEVFPEFQFRYVVQVHGNLVVPAAPVTADADGHFTSDPGVAVVVQTADCVPILLANENQVCALHAGWRGVAQNIVANAPADLTTAAIGPHIGVQSFEIGRDVEEMLEQGSPVSEKFAIHYSHLPDRKVHYDLRRQVRAQLLHKFNSQIAISEFCPDTKTSPNYCSYRRDGPGAGRQFSFVVLNP